MPAYSETLKDIRAEFKDFKVVPKSESRVMRLIDFVLKVITFGQMKIFMTGFITTLGTTVYVPKSWDETNEILRVITLRHERIHMRQARKYTRPLFSFMYLFLLPSVWTFRAKFEMEAYEETMRSLSKFCGHGTLNDELKASMVKHFTSAEYFWMKPSKKSVEKWFDETRDKIAYTNKE